MNLYEVMNIENEIEAIASQNDGEIPEEMFQALIEAQTKSIEKVENICKYIQNVKAYSEALDIEIKRLQGKKTACNNRVESIKKYMTPFVTSKGKIKAGIFNLSIRKSEQLNIVDADKVPARFVTITETKSISKADIKKELKLGVAVPGVEIVENDNLQIK